MTTATQTLDRLAIDTIRTLSIDGVQKANSGHPGAPMGAAPMAYTLWTRFLRHAPTHPDWPDRDRFVLSAGHASMLLYSLLHLTGYDVTLDDLKSFRQWGSKTPGHPEYGLTPGVEATTGPLGQGFANAVGMAIAEVRLAAEFNRDGHDIVDHWTYTLCSDGDLQEGIASEAASLAGPPPAPQARRPLRRQPHPARRPDIDGLVGGRRRPVRCLWLARHARGGRQRHRGDRRGDRGRPRGRTPEPDRGPDAHRVRQPEPPGHAEGARPAAWPGRGPARQGGIRLGSRQDLLRPGRGARPVPAGRPGRRRSRCRVGASLRRVRRSVPGQGGGSSAAGSTRGHSPRAGIRVSRRSRSARRSPRGTRARTRSRRSQRPCRSSSAARPTCRNRT